MVICPSSRVSSSSSLADTFLPHFASEEEDWRSFAYLLDDCKEDLPDVQVDWEMEDDNDETSVEEEPTTIEIVMKKDKEEANVGGCEVGGIRVSRRIQEILEKGCMKKNRKKLEGRRNARKGSGRFAASPVRKRRAVDTMGILHGSQKGHCHGWASDSENKVNRAKRIKVQLPEKYEDTRASVSTPNTSNCVCNKPYDSKKVYVKCEKCARRFHAHCVGLRDNKARNPSSFTCPDCIDQAHRVYCLCRTPYDDSRFYVGCDSCDDWFHPSCAGITQEEAESAAEYICPLCIRRKKEKK